MDDILNNSHCIKQQQRPFNGPLSRTTWVSQYQKGRINLHFTEARQRQWQWHQLDDRDSETDKHTSTAPLNLLQARCPTNSIKALNASHFHLKVCENIKEVLGNKVNLCAGLNFVFSAFKKKKT